MFAQEAEWGLCLTVGIVSKLRGLGCEYIDKQFTEVP